MAEESNQALALLDGTSVALARIVRAQTEALGQVPATADPTAIDKTAKAVIALARADLMIRAVVAAEERLAEDRERSAARRTAKLDQMDMNDITPDELERRAGELRARADRILALLEAKHFKPDVEGSPAGEPGVVDRQSERRAA